MQAKYEKAVQMQVEHKSWFNTPNIIIKGCPNIKKVVYYN